MKKRMPEKGSYGYIDRYKSAYLTKVILWVLAIAVVIGGAALYFKTKYNYVTIVGILMVLPAAKTLIGYIVMMPYKTASEADYKAICTIAGSSVKVLSDMVITRYEGAMMLSMAVITGNGIYAYMPAQKTTKSKVENYLSEIAKTGGAECKAFVYDEMDTYKKTIERIAANNENGTDGNHKICESLLSATV